MAMYTVLSIRGPRLTEHTNVGVAIYDGEELFGCIAEGPERAITRGDLRPGAIEYHSRASFERTMRSCPTMKSLRSRICSLGGAMSYIQFRDPLWMLTANTEALHRLFHDFVQGGAL